MTVELQIPEAVKAKVKTRDQFDQEYKDEVIGAVGGYTSFSFSRFCEGVAGENFWVQPSIYYPDRLMEKPSLTIDLKRKVYEEVFGWVPQDYSEYPMQVNSRQAINWVLLELLEKELGANYKWSRNIYELFQPKFITWQRQIKDGVFRLNDVFDQATHKEKLLLNETFLDRLDLYFFLKEFNHRGGVQMVFPESNRLTAFLRNCKKARVNDSVYQVLVFDPVPSELVQAVIPLGKYEEDQLLSLRI